MDSRGVIIIDETQPGGCELLERLRRAYPEKWEGVRDIVAASARPPMPTPELKEALLEIAGEDVVVALAGMNRRQRLVFRSERRRGASEQEALELARESLPR